MAVSPEQLTDIKTLRIPAVRGSLGPLGPLADSIREEGLRRPVTAWDDGTIISGARRLRACILLMREQMPVVFVDTVEDAAKRLLADLEDDFLALPMRWSEVCRLWEVLRRLDAPAAVRRLDEARRRGVQLRRKTAAGERSPGRSSDRTDDHVLSIVCAPFGLSSTSAKRLWAIYSRATGVMMASDDARARAVQSMKDVDSGASSIYAAYQALGIYAAPTLVPAARPRPAGPVEPVPAARQLAAWDKALPQLEGLVGGLAELGPPSAELNPEDVRAVRARLSTVRRDLEQMIKKMKETNPS